MSKYFKEEIIVSFLKHIWEFAKLNKDDRDKDYSRATQTQIDKLILKTKDIIFINQKERYFFTALQLLYAEKPNTDIAELELQLSIAEINKISEAMANAIVTKVTNSELKGDADFLGQQYKIIIKQYKLDCTDKFITEIKQKVMAENVEQVAESLEQFYQDQFKIIQEDEQYIQLQEKVSEYVDTINDKSSHLGEPTGIKSLDAIIGGLLSSNFIVVAARPSVGKSAFAINLIGRIFRNNAIQTKEEKKKAVLFISLEMSNRELTWRFIANVAGIDSKKVQKKDIDDDELALIKYNTNKVWRQSCVMLSALTTVGVDDIEKMIHKIKLRYNLKIVIIDYIQLMSSVHHSQANREQEVAKISRRLKIMAARYKLCIIGLSQLSRRIEQRENKEPLLSDLRESGAIEQDADIIIFLYNKGEASNVSKNADDLQLNNYQKDIVNVKVGKNRNGPIGYIRLFFEKRFQQFRELTQTQFNFKNS